MEPRRSAYTSFNTYFQDESRFGLFTRSGRGLTAKGVMPLCPEQHQYEYRYLFGAFSPINGNNLLLEFPCCNTEVFQYFLDRLAVVDPQEFKILFLDNAGWHHAKALQVPQNMALIFLPPYSPELNPAEKVWQHVKAPRVYTHLF